MQAMQEGQCSALPSACQMSRAPAMKLSGSISSKGWEERSHISQEMACTCTETRPIIQGMRLNSSAQPRPNSKKPCSFPGVSGFKKNHHSSWAPQLLCVCLFCVIEVGLGTTLHWGHPSFPFHQHPYTLSVNCASSIPHISSLFPLWVFMSTYTHAQLYPYSRWHQAIFHFFLFLAFL